MTDLEIIKETLEASAHRQWCDMKGIPDKDDAVLKEVDSALSALERVSALQAEMEAALEKCGSLFEEMEGIQWFPESDFGMKEVRPAQEAVLAIIRPKESR